MKLSLFMTLAAFTSALVAAQPGHKGGGGGHHRGPDHHGGPKGGGGHNRGPDHHNHPDHRDHRDGPRNSQKGRDHHNHPHRSPSDDDWPERKWSRDKHSQKGQDSRSGNNDDDGPDRKWSRKHSRKHSRKTSDTTNKSKGTRSSVNTSKGTARSTTYTTDRSYKSPTISTDRSGRSNDDDSTDDFASDDRSGCVPDDRPESRRDAKNYRFELVQSRARCTDADGKKYEYGAIDDVGDFGDCARACVQDVRSSLLDSDGFRGVDFDCRYNVCRCLYDEGTLDRDSSGFDRTYRDESGHGPIDGAKASRSSKDFYCGRLEGSDFVAASGLLKAE